jgi:hypothetical protein
MAQDYFVVLGLTPGRWKPREIAARFLAERKRALAELDRPGREADARRRLDELHIAYSALRDPRRQEEYLQASRAPADPYRELRRMIAASLEDGLLRYSRRQQILARAAELGIGDFQAQLMIAQVQFGGDDLLPAADVAGGRGRSDTRLWARAAAVGVLALAAFLGMVHWLGT